MTNMPGFRKFATLTGIVGLCLILAGCLLMPGRFAANLDIRKSGAFTYRYTGEIKVVGLVEIARMQAQQQAANDKFEPHCWGKPAAGAAVPDADAATVARITTPGTRACTDAEIAQQRKVWEDTRKQREANDKRQMQQLSALMGGIDPTSPAAAEELAARLRHQAGWSRVDYKGDGVFDVDFSASGRLTHDFAFPTVEKMPTATPFLAIYRHADGSLRIDAAGFVGGENNSFAGMMMAMGNSEGAGAPPSALSTIDGHFTITTDAAILANNTDDGPRADAAGQRLEWAVTPRSTVAPSALLRLGGMPR